MGRAKATFIEGETERQRFHRLIGHPDRPVQPGFPVIKMGAAWGTAAATAVNRATLAR